MGCMEGDEAEHFCSSCWELLHVDELPECMADGHSHRATYLVAFSSPAPSRVDRLYFCPAERALYEAQGYKAARLIREEPG
jgi:hypothetical protein